jgi:hypothetical protein
LGYQISFVNSCAGYFAHPFEFLANGGVKSLKIGYHAGQSWNRLGVGSMIKALIHSLKRFVGRLKQYLKLWSRLVIDSIAVGSLSDLRHSSKYLTFELFKQMASENGLWNAERIRGELLMLGVKVSKRTI